VGTQSQGSFEQRIKTAQPPKELKMTAKLLTIFPILFTACSADMKQIEDRGDQKGRISMPLTATSSTGADYIVELPYVSLESDFEYLEFSLQQQTQLDVSLHEGNWEVYVGEYELYRQDEDGEYHYVDSELTSLNPQNIQIFADEVTYAQLNFRVAEFDEDIVTDGHLSFEINIDDGPDENDEQTNTALSQEEALQLVIDQVLTPQGITEDNVIVYSPGHPLVEGDEVRPVLSLEGDAPITTVIEEDTWFFWVDLAPFTRFAHATLFVYVDQNTQAITYKEESWFAMLNDEPLRQQNNYEEDEFWVYGTPTDDVFVQTSQPSQMTSRSVVSSQSSNTTCSGRVAIVVNGDDQDSRPTGDAEAMRKVFFSRGYKVVDVSSRGFGDSATETQLEWYLKQEEGQRNVPLCQFVFYYSGHGSTTGDLVFGESPNGIDGITPTHLALSLAKIDACEFVIILDSCKAGLFPISFEQTWKGQRPQYDLPCATVMFHLSSMSNENSKFNLRTGSRYTTELLKKINAESMPSGMLPFATNPNAFSVGQFITSQRWKAEDRVQTPFFTIIPKLPGCTSCCDSGETPESESSNPMSEGSDDDENSEDDSTTNENPEGDATTNDFVEEDESQEGDATTNDFVGEDENPEGSLEEGSFEEDQEESGTREDLMDGDFDDFIFMPDSAEESDGISTEGM